MSDPMPSHLRVLQGGRSVECPRRWCAPLWVAAVFGAGCGLVFVAVLLYALERAGVVVVLR